MSDKSYIIAYINKNKHDFSSFIPLTCVEVLQHKDQLTADSFGEHFHILTFKEIKDNSVIIENIIIDMFLVIHPRIENKITFKNCIINDNSIPPEFKYDNCIMDND